jgi:hypothetical protein
MSLSKLNFKFRKRQKDMPKSNILKIHSQVRLGNMKERENLGKYEYIKCEALLATCFVLVCFFYLFFYPEDGNDIVLRKVV